MYKEELGAFFRELAKSTISENFRESVISNYTPRVSNQPASYQELPIKDSSEVTPSYHRPDSPNRPSSFLRKKDFLPIDSRKTVMKRGFSAKDIRESQDNPLEMIEKNFEKTNNNEEKHTENLNFFLILSENEKLQAEIKKWRILVSELEKREAEIKIQFEAEKKREMDVYKAECDVKLKEEIRDTVRKFAEEKVAWENDLRRLREVCEKKSRELEISQGNNEKLQRAIGNLKQNEAKMVEYEKNIGLYLNEIEKLNEILRKKAFEIKELESKNNKNGKNYEEIEQWKARNSKLELRIQEIQSLEGVLFENEGKMANLMRENDTLKLKVKETENKVALLSMELERLTNISNKKLEENDALKKQVNKLEIIITEYRLKEGKLQKELAEIKKT